MVASQRAGHGRPPHSTAPAGAARKVGTSASSRAFWLLTVEIGGTYAANRSRPRHRIAGRAGVDLAGPGPASGPSAGRRRAAARAPRCRAAAPPAVVEHPLALPVAGPPPPTVPASKPTTEITLDKATHVTAGIGFGGPIGAAGASASCTGSGRTSARARSA